MERLRAVLVALRRGSAANAPVPTYIYVFKNPKALEPYLPPGDEEADEAQWASFFQSGPDSNYAMFSAAWNADPRPSVYHSYIYNFIDENFEGLPLWYEVGVAGYYSTFQTEGGEARTGIVPQNDLELLRRRGMWMPLDRLLAATYDCSEYKDPDQTGLFFAESWALVHYLMQGNESRTPQLGRYLALVRAGRPQDEAFREAFGTDYATLYGELHGYIRNNKRFLYNRFQFADLNPPSEASTRPMSYEDAVLRLGDLLARTRRFAEAERFYEAVLTENPSSAGALGGLAWVRKRQERTEEAAALWRRAAEAGSTDFRVHYWNGRQRWDEIGTSYDPDAADQRALLEAARAAFRRSADLNPDFAEALAMYGRTYRYEPWGADVDPGIAALEEAAKRLPKREDVVRDLTQLRNRKNEGAQAAKASSAPNAPGGANPNVPDVPNAAPRPSGTPGRPAAVADFDAEIERINGLISAGKLDEAIAAVDVLIEQTGGATRAKLVEERERLRKSAERKRAKAPAATTTKAPKP